MKLNTQRKFLAQGLTSTSPLFNGNVKLRDILNIVFTDISSLTFSLPNLCIDHSDTADLKRLDNRPTDIYHYTNILQCTAAFLRIVQNVCSTNVELFQHLDSLKITSQYRTPEVNRAVGGSKTSLHLQGLALDFVAHPTLMLAIYDYLTYSYMDDERILKGLALYRSAVFPYEVIKYYRGAKDTNVEFIHIGFKFVDRNFFNRQQKIFNV